MNTLYPKLLVFLQFSIAGILILLSHDFFSHAYALSIFVMGACIGLWAMNHNKLGNFNIQPKHKEGSYLVTTGIYKLIRHPMYTSVIVMMFAFVMTTYSLLSLGLYIALIIVLVLKLKREETLLLKVHPDYKIYRKNSKYLIPYIL